MASAKAIEGWFDDLREGTPKKRENAARNLATRDPARARAVLLEVLDAAGGGSRKPIAKSLHWVADIETARMLATDKSLTFMPERLPSGVLVALYDELRAQLPKLGTKETQKRLAALQVFEVSTAQAARTADGPAQCEALVALLLAVFDDQPAAADQLRRIDTERGNAELYRRWREGSPRVGGLSAYASWVRVGCPALDVEERTRLFTALVAELEGLTEEEVSDDSRLDTRFHAGVPHVPPALAIPLLVALERYGNFPATAGAVAQRVVGLATSVEALTALLDDSRLGATHRLAAESLMTRGPNAAHEVVMRGRGLDRGVLTAALGKAEPGDLYALLVDEGAGRFVEGSWYEVVVAVEGGLRHARWLDLAPNLHDQGRALYVAIARDPRNDARARAVERLSALAAAAKDRLEKRHALFALGETGHPAATTALVDALDAPDIGDAAPLICTALATCGDTRAIPVLEKRLGGPHTGFVRAAIDRIRARASDIHANALLAACQDDDPQLADLARQARDGDMAAAIVLEDALRELGRL